MDRPNIPIRWPISQRSTGSTRRWNDNHFDKVDRKSPANARSENVEKLCRIKKGLVGETCSRTGWKGKKPGVANVSWIVDGQITNWIHPLQLHIYN